MNSYSGMVYSGYHGNWPPYVSSNLTPAIFKNKKMKKKMIYINELNRILEEKFNCNSCFIDSINIVSENGIKNIKIGAGGILDIYMNLTE